MCNRIIKDSGNIENHDVFTLLCYNEHMTDSAKTGSDFYRPLTDEELALAIQRRKEGMKLHEIEGMPLDAEQVAMFEMFERERWSHEKRRAYITERWKKRLSDKK